MSKFPDNNPGNNSRITGLLWCSILLYFCTIRNRFIRFEIKLYCFIQQLHIVNAILIEFIFVDQSFLKLTFNTSVSTSPSQLTLKYLMMVIFRQRPNTYSTYFQRSTEYLSLKLSDNQKYLTPINLLDIFSPSLIISKSVIVNWQK